MNRNNNFPFIPRAIPQGIFPIPQGIIPLFTPIQPIQLGSFPFAVNTVPQNFREAMKRISVKPPENQNVKLPEMAPKTPAALIRAVNPPAFTWKPSFIGDEDDNPHDRSADKTESPELYDPYNPDSDHEMPQDQDESHSTQNTTVEPAHSSSSKGRWDIPYYKTRSQPPDSCDRSPEKRPRSSVAHSLHEPLGYGSKTTTGRLSPASLKNNSPDSGHNKKGLDEIICPPEVTSRPQHIIMERAAITCDLCDIEFANGQEIQDHLESRTHWDTMEHIQQENDYDDMAIAFLQEVMLHKSQQYGQPMEDSVLEELQKKDHMTKIEVFHCTACNVFVSSSVSSVHAHITCAEHLANTKEFKVLQRRTCLDKAQTIIKELQPQFEHFLKGGSLFE